MNTECDYILKLKSLGWTSEKIAARIGKTKEAVEAVLASVAARQTYCESSGHKELCEKAAEVSAGFAVFALAFGAFLNGLLPPVTEEDLRASIVPGDAEQTVRNLRSRFLILPPFQARPIETPGPSSPHVGN